MLVSGNKFCVLWVFQHIWAECSTYFFIMLSHLIEILQFWYNMAPKCCVLPAVWGQTHHRKFINCLFHIVPEREIIKKSHQLGFANFVRRYLPLLYTTVLLLLEHWECSDIQRTFFLFFVIFEGKKTETEVEEDLISPWILPWSIDEVMVVVLKLSSIDCTFQWVI